MSDPDSCLLMHLAQACHHLQDHLGRRRGCANRGSLGLFPQVRVQRRRPRRCRRTASSLRSVVHAAEVRALQDQYAAIFIPRHSYPLLTSSPPPAVLDSEFSESNSTARLSPSRSIAPDERFSGDVDEFAAFGVPEPPGQDEQPQQDAAASEKDDAPEQQAKQDQLASPPDSARGESVRAEEQKNLRDFRLVKVPDCRFVPPVHHVYMATCSLSHPISYATLAAYLSYLYSSSFDFLPSPSVLLAEDKEPVSLTKSDFSKWADEQAKSRNYPVLPHAMYRLADCYMEPKVKKRAKEWILQHIKAETASGHRISRIVSQRTTNVGPPRTGSF